MTESQYEALVKLMRGDPLSAGNRAARLVLVNDMCQADAMRETGASRSTVHLTTKRYRDADELVREAYHGARPADRITSAQFDALVKLMRGDPHSPASQAARLVLIEGYKQAEAMRATDASRSTVHISVKRYQQADELLRYAYAGVGGNKTLRGLL